MARTFANPERPFQVTDQSGLAQLGDQVMSGELGFAPAGITAFHGTPHNILGKFDISKVGTGEGAQAYGHGMYFAENPSVAKQYQAALSDTKYFADGKQLKGNDAWAAQFLHDFQDDALPKKVDVNTAVAKANEILKAGESREEIVNKIKQLDKTGVSVESGNLYKVDIPDAQVPKMLDWDKPLKDQPKDVQDALAKYDPYLYSKDGDDYDPMETGQSIYQRIATTLAYGKPDVSNVYKESSDVLNSLGIKGIRYLDEGSRSKPYSVAISTKKGLYAENEFITKEQAEQYIKEKQAEGFKTELKEIGTSNFVVFDPTDVKILERNNQPVQGLLDPKMTLDEFTQMSNKGQMRQARTVDQDLEDILAKKMPATKFDFYNNSKYGLDYEMGDFTKKLKDAGLTVYDDKMGTVIAGQSKEAVEKLKNASTPIEYGQSFGYEPEDILKFYIQRRGGNPELGYSDFINDMNLINQSEGLLGK
jgi:hypothetical protein